MPLQQTIIPLSKRKLTLLLLAALILIVAGCWLIASRDHTRNPSIALLAGASAILLFGCCVIVMLRKLKDNKPGLILDEQGITDNSSGVSGGIIPWPDIEQVSVLTIQGQQLLMIRVRDPQQYIDRQTNGMKRKIMTLNYKLYGSPLSISANSLKISFTELQQLVSNYLDASRR